MRRPPTDLEILEEIYRRHYPDFVDPKRLERNPRSKIHVPIDLEAVAAHFGVDSDIIFGRLYYHLNAKHGFDQDGSRVDLFLMQLGGERHCVQFPPAGFHRRGSPRPARPVSLDALAVHHRHGSVRPRAGDFRP